MLEMQKENEKLKMILGRIAEDYRGLQMRFFDAFQQEQVKNNGEQIPVIALKQVEEKEVEKEPFELVSLRLGTSSSFQKKEEKIIRNDDKKEECLTLGLGETLSMNSENNTFEDAKQDEVSQQPLVKKPRVSVRARCDAPTVSIQLLIQSPLIYIF